MVDETTKVDQARQDRLREQQVEKQKPKQQESEFDQLLKKQPLSQQLAQQPQSKNLTEQAIHEATKHQDRDQDERRKDEGEQKGKKETRSGGEHRETRTADHRVIAKGTMGQGSGGREGGGKEGGFEGGMGRRGLATKLTRAGAKSVPTDLSGKFALKMSQMSKSTSTQQAVLTPEALNKIVQYVRIGINRAGEKEIQLDLHGEIFQGLKLRVTARGGKVAVHFRTSDAKGRALFEKNSGAIRDALSKKGIEVDELTVS
jgi:hypothetical protein